MAQYSLRQIAFDLVQGKLQMSEAELAKERIKVCEICPEFKKIARQCAICSCFMDMKVKILLSTCPLQKW